MLFSDEKINLEEASGDEFDEDTLHMRQLLKTELTEFGLSVRALNCLKTAEVFTLGELVAFKKSDMLKFRNFGKKSLTELEELVKEKGLTFGFNSPPSLFFFPPNKFENPFARFFPKSAPFFITPAPKPIIAPAP